MKIYHESDMTKGWIIGDFLPCVIPSKYFEVGLKRYKKNEFEQSHTHKIATEITMVIEGSAKMNEKILEKGTIILIEPGESTNFLALEDTITMVIKTPSIPNDKYYD